MSPEQTDTFTLAATGDSILTRSVIEREGDPDFGAVVDRLRDADAAVTNLEAVVTDGTDYATPPRAIRDQYQYLSSFPGMVLPTRPRLVDELSAMGFDLVSAASNHSYDFGRRGMESTMAALEERDVGYAGLGRTLPDAQSPAYTTTPGGRVGIVGACTSVAPGSEAGDPSSLLPGRPGINPLHVNWTYRVTSDRMDALREIGDAAGVDDAKSSWVSRADSAGSTDGYDFMHMRFEEVDDESEEGIEQTLSEPDLEAYLAQVREAASMADWVVATVHAHQGPAGSRNVPETPAFLERFARECVDAGADVVVGTGPHVLRGIELYDGSPIFYSLGNFFCQFETIDLLPAESFDYYDVEDDRYPSRVFDTRYFDEDGEPTGNMAYTEYWQTVVPTCEFDEDGRLRAVELLPCSLGRTRDRSERGTPQRATGAEAEAILDDLAALSEPFGTDIDRVDGVGVVELE